MHSKHVRIATVGAALVLGLGIVACGDDDDGGGGAASGGGGEDVKIGLITKTETNPFFVKMKEGAQGKASELGAEVQSFAGKKDGDNESQVAAVESLIGAGAQGILITPNNSSAIVPSVDKARQAGLLVIALDTELDAADATFATDNYKAGLLIGQWAKAKFEADGKEAKIAMLDLNTEQVTVDVQRDQGFLEGFGIDVGDNTQIGVEDVKKGIIGATSQQYPLKMAEMGVQAVADFAETGEKPQPEAGKEFIDTGVTLITDEPQDGVESEDTAFGLENCWG